MATRSSTPLNPMTMPVSSASPTQLDRSVGPDFSSSVRVRDHRSAHLSASNRRPNRAAFGPRIGNKDTPDDAFQHANRNLTAQFSCDGDHDDAVAIRQRVPVLGDSPLEPPKSPAPALHSVPALPQPAARSVLVRALLDRDAEVGKRERAWRTDRTLYVSGSAGSNEHGEIGRQERGPGEDSLEKS